MILFKTIICESLLGLLSCLLNTLRSFDISCSKRMHMDNNINETRIPLSGTIPANATSIGNRETIFIPELTIIWIVVNASGMSSKQTCKSQILEKQQSNNTHKLIQEPFHNFCSRGKIFGRICIFEWNYSYCAILTQQTFGK